MANTLHKEKKKRDNTIVKICNKDGKNIHQFTTDNGPNLVFVHRIVWVLFQLKRVFYDGFCFRFFPKVFSFFIHFLLLLFSFVLLFCKKDFPSS